MLGSISFVIETRGNAWNTFGCVRPIFEIGFCSVLRIRVENKLLFFFFFSVPSSDDSIGNFRRVLIEVTFALFESFVQDIKNNCRGGKIKKRGIIEFFGTVYGMVFRINSRNVYPLFDDSQLDGCGF